MSGCGCGGSGAIATSQNGSMMLSASMMSATQQVGALSPNAAPGGFVEQGYIIPEATQNPFANVDASNCLKEITKKTDIIVQQGVSFELRVCLHGVIEQIRCFETSGDLTLPVESCLQADDNVEIACITDCAYQDFEGEQVIGNVSDDKLTVTMNPVPATPTEQRCFQSTAPVIGCLTQAPENLPVLIELESTENLNFYGHVSRSLPRREKDFGVNTQSGSNYIQTTVLGLVRIGDFISIPSADIDNAEILNVERVTYNNGNTPVTVDVIELDKTATQSGCFHSTLASGKTIDFSVRTDGSCVIFYLSALQTSTMIPMGAHDMIDDGVVRGHYGFYSLNYSGVIADPNDATMVYPITVPVASGRLLVDYSSAASVGIR